MNIDQYQSHTERTAIYPGAGSGSAPALSYVTLGLIGESAEVLEKELAGDVAGVISELGDVAWYLARVHRELGADLAATWCSASVPADGDRTRVQVAHLVVAAGRVGEHVKKVVRDDAAVVTEERKVALVALMVPLLTAWLGVHEFYALDPAATLAGNVAKLADRQDRGVLTGSGDHR